MGGKMKPITFFNKWILAKVNNYLETKEGCVIQQTGYTVDGAKTIVHDSFGFAYEIHIKTIGRVNADSTEMDKYANKGA